MAELLVDLLSASIVEVEATPDQQCFLLHVHGNGSDDLVAVRRGDTLETPVVTGPDHETALDLSDDGQWVAYESITGTGREVYVSPFDDASGVKWQISTNGGGSPRWAPDGRELFYVDGRGMMMSARVQRTPSFRVLKEKVGRWRRLRCRPTENPVRLNAR
ncbi:MAG: hypothetical protein P8099_01145 [Gemmatimonadota bacterium]